MQMRNKNAVLIRYKNKIMKNKLTHRYMKKSVDSHVNTSLISNYNNNRVIAYIMFTAH